MKLSDYESILIFVERHTSKCNRILLADLLAKYKGQYPHHTLLSLFLNRLQRKLKASYHVKSKKDSIKLYYEIFTQKMALSQRTHDNNGKVLINIAIQFDLPPCLMSRLILEQYLLETKQFTECVNDGTKLTETSRGHISHQNDRSITDSMSCMRLDTADASSKVNDTNSKMAVPKPKSQECGDPESGAKFCSQSNMSTKNLVSLWMKDPYLIPDVCLRDQVLQCISYDICYGPINDAIRHSVGLEFEEKLKAEVMKVKLPFLDESDLRKRGYDKTPDVKLEVPIAICGHPVCWIESKASFGDLETHSEYLHGQYYSYWNRFGPGLVIYWFGFIDEISDEMLKQGILVLDRFPDTEQITFMNP